MEYRRANKASIGPLAFIIFPGPRSRGSSTISSPVDNMARRIGRNTSTSVIPQLIRLAISKRAQSPTGPENHIAGTHILALRAYITIVRRADDFNFVAMTADVLDRYHPARARWNRAPVMTFTAVPARSDAVGMFPAMTVSRTL